MSTDFTTQLALRLQDKYGPHWMLTTAANVMDEARILHAETSAAHDALVRRTALLEAAKAADHQGHLWSGAPAHQFFILAEDIRALADREEQQ